MKKMHVCKKIFSRTMIVLLLTGVLALSFNIQQTKCSEPPTTEWDRTYGGTSDEILRSLIQTSDGGYVLAGYTWSFGAGSSDFWLVKTNSTGHEQWNRTYGGTNKDEAWCVVQTSDEGYALAGETRSFGAGNNDAWLIKTDSAGHMEWNQTYGGTGYEYALSVVQTSDGGYALAGDKRSSDLVNGYFWLVKTNSTGHEQWNRTYGGTSDEYAFSVVQTGDGGYALAGQTTSFGAGGYDFWLVKTDLAGDVEWSQTYGGTDFEICRCLVQTGDEGYALAGYTESLGAGGYDFWLVKTDQNGNMEWNRTYGGTSDEYAFSVVQTGDGGYVLAGYTWSFGAGSSDLWLVKTDETGNMQWNRTYGGPNSESPDGASSVVETSDGGYALAGGTTSFGAGNSDFWLIKLAPEVIPATVDIDPDTLNLRSNGQWITAYIELPEEYNLSEIDVSTILLNGSISVDPEAPTAIGDYDMDGIADLMVKFDRAAVIALLGTCDYGEETGKSVDVALAITGEATGTLFEGVDTIRVLLKG